jgi:hypothetical protein
MNRSLLFTATIAILFTGCIPSSYQQSSLSASDDTKTLRFSTNESTFISTLKSNISKEERNEFIDEFILKSDIQCQQYLNNPKKDEKKSKSKDELYMNIAQSVSAVLGLGYITQTAQSIFSENDESSKEGQKAYENALSPEIKKGVEIVRERYATKIKKKKKLTIKEYTSNQVKEDMSIYDRQCNMEYGLIEINRALKEMQSQMRNNIYAKPVPKINLESVKEKVKNVTKQVKEKKSNSIKKIKPTDANLTLKPI